MSITEQATDMASTLVNQVSQATSLTSEQMLGYFYCYAQSSSSYYITCSDSYCCCYYSSYPYYPYCCSCGYDDGIGAFWITFIVMACVAVVAIFVVIAIQKCRKRNQARIQAPYLPVGVSPIVQPGNRNLPGNIGATNEVIVVPSHNPVPPAQNYVQNVPQYGQYNPPNQQIYGVRAQQNSQNYLYNQGNNEHAQ